MDPDPAFRRSLRRTLTFTAERLSATVEGFFALARAAEVLRATSAPLSPATTADLRQLAVSAAEARTAVEATRVGAIAFRTDRLAQPDAPTGADRADLVETLDHLVRALEFARDAADLVAAAAHMLATGDRAAAEATVDEIAPLCADASREAGALVDTTTALATRLGFL